MSCVLKTAYTLRPGFGKVDPSCGLNAELFWFHSKMALFKQGLKKALQALWLVSMEQHKALDEFTDHLTSRCLQLFKALSRCRLTFKSHVWSPTEQTNPLLRLGTPRVVERGPMQMKWLQFYLSTLPLRSKFAPRLFSPSSSIQTHFLQLWYKAIKWLGASVRLLGSWHMNAKMDGIL